MHTRLVVRVLFLAVLIVSSSSFSVRAQLRPELAPAPPMGWNSWNWHGKHKINEQVVRETIDALVETGLADAGYNHVVVDGGWRDVKLGPAGKLLPHPEKFPNGIKPLADYAHSKGLKFGVHVVPGTHDCGGDPVGAWGNEEVHLQQFVDWGLDFIKLDLCRMTEDPCLACPRRAMGWSEAAVEKVYRRWSELLAACGRDILFSISAYQYRSWYPDVCNMARTSGDIEARCTGGAMFNPPDSIEKRFFSVMEIALSNNLSASEAGNGYWNDPDMMVTGDQGLSRVEQESHFALWCMMSSPLMLGNDPRNMTSFELDLITNPELIAINQDPAGQGRLLRGDETGQVWVKDLSDGSMAVLLLNLDRAGEREVTLGLDEIGLDGSYRIRDLLQRKDAGKARNKLSRRLETNACAILLISQ